MAGRLSEFFEVWQGYTNDRYILNAIKGIKLEFVDGKPPVQKKIPHQIRFNEAETTAIAETIQKLIGKGVIVPSVAEKGQYINTIFTRPKKDGSHRMILNLKPLNEFILYKKFKMDTLQSVLKLMKRNCFMAAIDIADAYYTVKVDDSHQKYLKFYWQDQLYKLTALPMGYSASPRIFTKILKPLLAHLHRSGHTIVAYIDDIYIQGDTEAECRQAVQNTIRLLEQCGFLINYPKSKMDPGNSIEYLGFNLDSNNMVISLPKEKIDSISLQCSQIIQQPIITIRELARITGKLISTFPAMQYGPLHYRAFEKLKCHALLQNKDNYDALVLVSPDIVTDLHWWIENLQNAYTTIDRGPVDIELETDATLEAWGATCLGEKTGGFFSYPELMQGPNNINAFELVAVYLALQAFRTKLQNKNVLVRSDNTTAVAYISHMGGSKSDLCNKIVNHIWEWCIANHVWLSAEYLAGSMNFIADYESRHNKCHLEWALCPNVFNTVCARLGRPEIDLFASRLNAKLHRFASWRPEPGAEFVNAFSVSWANMYCYIFPPFSLLAQCLKKVRLEVTEALIIAPLWPTQVWFAQLMEMLVEIPVVLPRSPQLLKLMHKPTAVHSLHRRMRLIACRISGEPTRQREFRRRQLTSLPHLGDRAPRNSMAPIFTNGLHFVTKGILITINRL